MAKGQDPRPPVFIVICKTKKIADTIHAWISQEAPSTDVPPHGTESLKNKSDSQNTIKVYSDAMQDSQSDNKNWETMWMRFTLQSIGKQEWPKNFQGQSIYPDGFLETAEKLQRPLHPPGRDVRCIVSVSMLTEGWDCNTVTHIVGLRPFQSQLLCEQEVGRGLQRISYDLDEETGFFGEENALVLGVPFEVIPVRTSASTPKPPIEYNRVFAVPSKQEYEITFPRVEKFITKISSRIQVDWQTIPSIQLDPQRLPAEVELRGLSIDTNGRPSYQGPGEANRIGLDTFRNSASLQSLSWAFASNLTRRLVQERENLQPHTLFPQLYQVVQNYILTKVTPKEPYDKRDVFLQPFYGNMENAIYQCIQSADEEDEELPIFESHRPDGSTKFVDRTTKKPIYPVKKSHLNAIIADTPRFEQSAAFVLDANPHVISFVKNTGLGFRIPYWIGEEEHDYEPDFILRIKRNDGSILNLILETKGYDRNQDVETKTAAAHRWVNAVNRYGKKEIWDYCLVKDISTINTEIEKRL